MTNKKKLTDALVWIDCEMTGLDLEHDALIEVAVIITDKNLNPVDDGLDILIPPSNEALEQMNDFVRNMHTVSGLLTDLANTSTTMAEANRQIMDYLKSYLEPGKALLAGNSVGMDKAFLSRDLPEVIDFLHYRLIDVSSIKELARRWYPKAYYHSPDKTGGHRALGDIKDSIMELDYYRRALFPKDEGPTSEELTEAAKAARTEIFS
ncbi:oligoribonuclease [Boudabousia tangfeifanii]|uniref:Oligoribonuclease n=1 Tax=Boudabousia tangfeifanii TaxID=1912795 RepID=A0A1D9MJM8_9ACTO|nr:oligoribonuclease [Boudabousia tangfeifanii]AOZ72393.1 oligoribonuclease [Boudabousia tangfeifanii]